MLSNSKDTYIRVLLQYSQKKGLNNNSAIYKIEKIITELYLMVV